MREAIAVRLASRTRDDWCRELDGSDACVAPVLSLHEAPSHPHAQARAAFVEIDGVVQAAPAPRFSRSVAGPPRAARAADGAWRRSDGLRSSQSLSQPQAWGFT
jgi:alpha-methylacyl-CoA racemase